MAQDQAKGAAKGAKGLMGSLGGAKGMIGPGLAIFALALMVLPAPAWLLDATFSFNIAASILVLLLALRVKRPADFSVFPALLLLATLLRLALNVASTRLILMQGHTGASAAGHVIESFGKFLLGGSFGVGLAVFAILMVINFVVITKGAGRIAEVSARFALDSLPGKQMAIDADLSAGLIGEKEARARREEVGREADFYGSMDGASKFVRGDAVAAMLILAIGLLGGMGVGMLGHGLDFSTAASNYFSLAIGDALAAQIPSLLLSVAAGVLISRSGAKRDLSDSLVEEVASAGPLAQSALGLAALGVLPGMPHLPFLAFAGALGLGAWALRRNERAKAEQAAAPAPEQAVADPGEKEVGWEDVAGLDAVALEIGYRLIPLADASKASGAELLPKIKAIRRRFAQEMGFLPPSLRIRDNLEIGANEARFLVKGVEVARAQVYPERQMALRDASARGPWPLEGIAGKDPAFGMPALWIAPQDEQKARALGLTLVSAENALATLFSQVLRRRAKDLFGPEQMSGLMGWRFNGDQKAIGEALAPPLSADLLRKVFCALLDEGAPIRDVDAILSETRMAAKKTDDPQALAQAARAALGEQIAAELFGPELKAQVHLLDQGLEDILTHSLAGAAQAVDPNLLERLVQGLKQAEQTLPPTAPTLALLVSDKIRAPLSQILRKALPELAVLGYSELPGHSEVSVLGKIG